MNAFYWIGNCSNEKHITVYKGERRDVLCGNNVIAEYEVKGIFKKLKLVKDLIGSEKDLIQANYTAKQYLKMLKKEKVL